MSTILDLLNSKYTVFVGSDAGNDVVFTEAGVSHRHCQISKVGDNNFLVADLGSATCTFVNNKKIDEEFITESDFITVGEYRGLAMAFFYFFISLHRLSPILIPKNSFMISSPIQLLEKGHPGYPSSAKNNNHFN